MKKNWPMRIASILLCLVLLSSYLVSGLYARYTTRASGEDEARVAKFVITTSGNLLNSEQMLQLKLVPGTHNQEIIIKNDSEVAVDCTLTIKNETNNLPLTFGLGDVALDLNGKVTSQVIAPNSEVKLNLKINWAITDATNYIGMVDLIKIKANINQVD